jgi:hypothetical protein
MTIKQVAAAFAEGKPAKCHNAHTDGTTYWLYGHKIAQRCVGGLVLGWWCGWHTTTTANHLRHIARAVGGQARSRTFAKLAGEDMFTIKGE